MKDATAILDRVPSPATDEPTLTPGPKDLPHRLDFDGDSDLPSPKPVRSYRLILKRAGLVLLAALAMLAATKFVYGWWTAGRFMETTDDAYVGGDVTVIASKVSGFIAQVVVTDNQAVHAGDLLIKLDDRDYRAALDKADAAVVLQQATLTNLAANLLLQDAIIAEARASVAAAGAEIVRTRDDQARARQLVTNGAESVQDFQKADADYKEALAAGEKSQAALAAAQQQAAVIASQQKQTLAALAATLADRDLARLNFSYTELRAPIDGSVGNRSAQVGAYSSAGAQLISLVPARGLWIDANFKESQLGRLLPGSPVSIRVDSLPGQTFHGRVASIAPATGAQFSILPPENATGNFTKIVQRVAVRILLDNEAAAQGQLRPGLSVIAKVDTRIAHKDGL